MEARPCAPLGIVSGWGAARETRERLSLGEDKAPLNAPSPPPRSGSDQLQHQDGCPATGGISPGPLNGARREKGLTLQPPDRPRGEGLKHSNPWDRTGNEGLNTPSIRPMLLAESYVKSAAAAFPLGLTFFRKDPGNGEGCPQVSMAGNTGKA